MAKRRSQQREQYFWSWIALFGFLALCAVSAALIARYGKLSPADLGFFDLVVMGLAAFRVIHLLTYDKIFGMVRAVFMDEKGGRMKNAERGWRRLVCEFLQCIWCTGMWSGLIVVTIYVLGPWGRFAAIVLAVAGLGTLLQVISKTTAAQA